MSAVVKIVSNPNIPPSIRINISADETSMSVKLYIQKPLELLGLIDILGKTVKPRNISNIEYLGDVEISNKIKNKIDKLLISSEIDTQDYIDFSGEKPKDNPSIDSAVSRLAENLSKNNSIPSFDSKRVKIANYVRNVLGPKYTEQEAYDIFVKAMNMIY